MNQTHLLDHKLNQTSRRWQWIRLAQYSAILAAAVSLVALLIGCLLVRGTIFETNTMIFLAVLLALVAVVAWVLILILVLAMTPQRDWLAARLEGAAPFLLDRVNTIVHLDKLPVSNRVRSYLERI